MSENVLAQSAAQDKKHLKPAEFIAYLVAVFFYTNMTGMIGSYRNAYLVDVLKINENQASLFNVLVSVIPFVLNFFIAMYIDGRSVGKKGKSDRLFYLQQYPAGFCLFSASGHQRL